MRIVAAAASGERPPLSGIEAPDMAPLSCMISSISTSPSSSVSVSGLDVSVELLADGCPELCGGTVSRVAIRYVLR